MCIKTKIQQRNVKWVAKLILYIKKFQSCVTKYLRENFLNSLLLYGFKGGLFSSPITLFPIKNYFTISVYSNVLVTIHMQFEKTHFCMRDF
jgi:hypothetical protein